MSKIQSISVNVDAVLFTIIEGKLLVLLVNRKYDPFKGSWALPGGGVEGNETIEQAIKREVEEETSLKNVPLFELKSFSSVHRDPRGRVISIVHIGVIDNAAKAIAGSDAQDVRCFSVNQLPSLAFDHKEMIMHARKYLAVHLWSSALTQYFLPKQFSLHALQQVYEAVSFRKRDVRNFRKKILSWGVLKQTQKYEQSVGHRPARLYEFKHKGNYLLP